jgi:hypothetical protein
LNKLLSGQARLPAAEAFDAEAEGARHGLQAVLELPQAESASIHICLDNISVIQCLAGTPAASPHDAFLEFQALQRQHGRVNVRWVPGHQGISGNEEADALAKASQHGHGRGPSPRGTRRKWPRPQVCPTASKQALQQRQQARGSDCGRLRRIIREKAAAAFKSWWESAAPARYKELGIQLASGCPPELELTRATLHRLLAARSRHGDFAEYHERFEHEDAVLECSCGKRKAPEHL